MRSSPLGLADQVGRNGEAVFARIDGEVVALNAAKGECYGLDAIGSEIWDLIEPPAAIGGVCETLLQRYNIDPATCRAQVLDLLEDLRAEGLLVVAAVGGR